MSSLKKMAEWALGKCGYNKQGEEILDPTPLEMPVGFETPQTYQQIMAKMLSDSVQRELAERGAETFEEANDFEMDGEDIPFRTPYEDPEFAEAIAREQEMRSGLVSVPDFKAAQEMVRKAKEVLSKYDKNGNLKEPPREAKP